MTSRICRVLVLGLIFLHVVPAVAQQKSADDSGAPASAPAKAPPAKRVEFGGELRARLEGLTGISFKQDNRDLYLLTRVRIDVKVRATDWLKFMAEGQDAHALWRNQKPEGPPYQDTFDLRQGYVELGNTETGSLGLRFGRQVLAFGDQRLIGPSNWSNTSRTFDGFHADFRRNGYRVDAIAVSVVDIREGHFNGHTPGNNLYGAYGKLERLIPSATIEPFFFWRRESGLTTEAGSPGILNFGTFGIRWAGRLPDGFDYSTEMARQVGSLGTDSISAWAGHWELGYTLAGVRANPRVLAEFNYATGDHNPNDGRRQTFDQLYPTAHEKYGMADEVGWKNIEHLRAGVELKPKPGWMVSIKENVWWLADSHDALYNTSSHPVAYVPNGTAGRYVGQELDVFTSYSLPHQVLIGSGFGRIFPGTFLRNATSGTPLNVYYTFASYTF
jgi:hypothetical protein